MSGCAAQPLPVPTGPVVLAAQEMVASGTPLHVRLDQPVGFDVSEVGHGFTASVVEPVYTSQGIVVIPSGASAIGTVISLDAPEDPAAPVEVGLRFDALRIFDRIYAIRTTPIRADVDPYQPRLAKGTSLRFVLEQPIDLHAPLAPDPPAAN
jgi:hypothetical protein